MSGQSIVDRVYAAKYSISGQGLAKSVHKATTEEVIGPKKKHLDYLLQCTNEPNVSVPNMADLLIERTQHTSWVVAFKALITIHNLMNYGNERFSQYLASNNCNFNLENFFDKTSVQVGAKATASDRIQAHDMSKFIRRYSKYIHEKCISYRNMAYDFCKVKRGKEDGLLRTMTAEKLLKTLPVLQNQLDALIDFDASPNDLTNGVINAAFLLQFKDLIRLFACYNDGIINLLEKYFEMNKKQCKDGLDLYKKFLVRMEKVSEFLKTAEAVGVDKGDIPDLAKAPASLLDALEQHLNSLEGKKGSTPTGTKPPPGATGTAASFGASGGFMKSSSSGAISEDERRRALEEETRTMQQLKGQTPILQDDHFKTSPDSSNPPLQSTNPFAAPAQSPTDLFGSSNFNTNSPPGGGPKLSDDLFGLESSGQNTATSSNPFEEVMALNNQAYNQQPQNHGFMSQQQQPQLASTNPWANNTTPAFHATTNGNKEINFEKAFGAQNNQQEAFSSAVPAPPPGFDGFGEVLAPSNRAKMQQQPLSKEDKLIKKDLDSSLANLVGNLNINGPDKIKKTDHNWNPSPSKGQKTGGANWQAPGMAPAPQWPQQQAQPPMGGQHQMGMAPGMQQQPMFGMAPGQQPMGFPQQQQPRPQMQASQQPFGDLL